MTTNTVEISISTPAGAPPRLTRRAGLAIALALALSQLCLHAGPAPSPWTPLFKGVDFATGTNQPGIPGNFSTLQTVRCVRVDLTDPDIRLFATPRAANYTAESRETLTLTVPHFLQRNQLQIACDADFYSANPGGSDPTAEGIPCEVFGLQISTGVVVSAETSTDAAGDPRYASLMFKTNNEPVFDFVNRPPGTNITGMYNAITGYYPIVSNGVNIGAAAINSYPDSAIHQDQPRTAFGVSQDSRYLYLMTIDGRQPGYSDGALDTETAYWIMQFGAWNAINMDGGGSTSMYMSDAAGNPVGLNHSSYLAAYGHERYIGSHFGVYAKPVPGFINDVRPQPDDTSATITWTTTSPATSLVQYGLTPSLGSTSDYSAGMQTNHAALLTGLLPGAGYYYQVVSSDGANQYQSDVFFFTTVNYATTNLIFDFSNVWTYATTNLDGVNWTAPTYDDSRWIGSGPGLLWVDTRGFANPNIPMPMLTQMPANPGTAYPFTTYYLRTHFSCTNAVAGTTLVFTDYIDDGAVFYLNGAEAYRLRMPQAPASVFNSTLASGYACGGDATCPDSFVLAGDVMTNLVAGDNVLAAQVHNFSAGSPDITFGVSLSFTTPSSSPPQLTIQQGDSGLVVSWSRGGFTLQQAISPAGPWDNVPGPVVSSPFVVTNASTSQYFRLIK